MDFSSLNTLVVRRSKLIVLTAVAVLGLILGWTANDISAAYAVQQKAGPQDTVVTARDFFRVVDQERTQLIKAQAEVKGRLDYLNVVTGSVNIAIFDSSQRVVVPRAFFQQRANQ